MKNYLFSVLILFCHSYFSQNIDSIFLNIPEGYKDCLVIIENKNLIYPQIRMLSEYHESRDSIFTFYLVNDTNTYYNVKPQGMIFANSYQNKIIGFYKNWRDTFRIDSNHLITFRNPIPELYYNSEICQTKYSQPEKTHRNSVDVNIFEVVTWYYLKKEIHDGFEVCYMNIKVNHNTIVQMSLFGKLNDVPISSSSTIINLKERNIFQFTNDIEQKRNSTVEYNFNLDILNKW